ncbi:MAG: dephospho-CoA kinase [Clostridiales bacterium]|nr:dephospho-CoA kinase [Clostridiales bacterium]
MKIAITGGIGSGKTLAIEQLKSMGYPVFSADEISRNLVNGPKGAEILSPLFPHAVKNGKVDRKALAATVFTDEAELKKLNAALHPAIMQDLYGQMNEAEKVCPLVFAEVPLLFESQTEKDFDRVWVIMRGEEDRVNSAAQRDGTTQEEVRLRIKNQIDYSNTDFSAHTVIVNGETKEKFLCRIQEEVAKILNSF